ncbi:Cytosine deaminase/metal-dependent hydrolase [Gaiella occulta]|uniref:Cytosine deaminase/metal-dependent hydrolase n=1 Tax=Gaiella occulta TaxID=1002870 RepID=A0A7M2YZK0_9ACTN|nr:amidohydrolase [Gaiella occulta]RDI75526.1 Cytosine deaminase/metal-dependent hydrolase [Gaiella occulta]
MATTLIRNLEFALTVDALDREFRDAAIVVDGERIVALGPSAEVEATHPPESVDAVVDGRRRGVVPGFVDAHVHLSETLSRAVFPDNLGTRAWVFHWAKPFYAHVGPEDEHVSVQLGVAEMLRSGTTCFLDMGSQHDAGITARAAAEVGIRGVVGRHAADVAPDVLPAGWTDEMVEHHFFPNADVALDVLEQQVRDWNGYADGRIRCWVNIEGKEPCSPELHVGARALSEQLGVGTTYHLASSIEEARVSERRHGRWPVTRIAELDGLGPNLVIAHGVAVKDEEIPLLARHDTKIAFCPSTSLKLAKGATAIGRYPEMRDAGVTVGLGTDGVAAAGNLNLMRQLYLAAGLFKDARLDESQIGAREALRMATIDGARALGWDDEIGSLEAGKRADFVLFDLDHHEWTPYDDPLQALVWSVSAASVAETWVDGQPLYRDGRILTLDEPELRTEARGRGAEIVRRAGLDRSSTPVTTTLYD